MTPASGLILAGGGSRRFGEDKALVMFQGRSMLARTIDTLSTVVDDILVVGRVELPPDAPPIRAIADTGPPVGPLAGMAAGLPLLSHPHAVVLSCDLPFVNPAVLRRLLSLAHGYQAVVPRIAGHEQPLHAVYARDIHTVIVSDLASGQYRARKLLEKLNVRWVEEDELRELDPGLRSFTDANTPEEWLSLQRSVAE